ncbi:restriction endonuclease subunit R [Luteimonas marina]|uniref:Restriction endonuclease subunit R n=1 Tax=Luteimonas marina TaxID=488485 RepID=A0A5C5TZE4_9GAMM|nr:DEAD/DEAH box helicase family protein [Luteimonas marina]TWT19144.1 restriction endonuclease subunit R [Luteimonas marina]
MSAFVRKDYQQRVLESVEKYFVLCHRTGDADSAFYQATKELWQQGQKFNPLPGFATDMPYFCLRVPTGGGKTFLAASSVALANTHLLRSEHSVVLWLVPSDAIREQTLKALRQPDHPYHHALREAGAVTVMDLDEAKAITRATLDTSTVVIVSTVQAFSRESTQGLKVYASSGALMQHFDHLSAAQRDGLLQDDDGTVPFSLANVLRLRRPFLVVDEAHNARTRIRFATFERFNPSGVMELTATPDLEDVPSNVLHSVGAAELKLEQMIKLPVLLEAEPDWQVCLGDAIARRGELQKLADEEHRRGAPYLRPLVLVQAEPRRQGVETLDTARVRQELIDNQRIPPEEIVIATGEERGLEALDREFKLGIADPACPVKFVLTQKALAEGWDCPFAYVLVGLGSQQSGTAVEQLLGRVLRQPDAKARDTAALNQSYAFVRSGDFARVANELRDGLVRGAGFERKDVSQFVAAQRQDQDDLDFGGRGKLVFTPVDVALPEAPKLRTLPKSVQDKLKWDKGSKTLTITGPLTESEAEDVQQAVAGESSRVAIAQAAEASRTTAVEFFRTPAELGERLRVPQLALKLQGELQLFDDPEALDYPWDLSGYDAAPTRDDISALGAASKVAEAGKIDVADDGKLRIGFLPGLQRDLGLSYQPEHWDETRLAAWLCRNLPEPSVTHASKRAFVAAWLRALLARDGFSLARANQLKFTVRGLLQDAIRRLRREAVGNAYQQTLFGEGREDRVITSDAFAFEFNPQAYAPGRDYDGRFGQWDFRKHFYGRVGDFDSKEEFECAVQLDRLAQQGRIRYWVRNLVNKPGCAFFLQKATGRFWPDFVCELNDGSILVVEYKGAQGWTDAQDDRDIGQLWAELSGGRCRFVMVRDRRWPQIEEALA